MKNALVYSTRHQNSTSKCIIKANTYKTNFHDNVDMVMSLMKNDEKNSGFSAS